MLGQFSIVQYLEFFARILVACVCGAAIGFERSKRFKEAGIRTHIIVCCAASLMMVVSKYGFADLVDPTGNGIFGSKGTDPARLAAQIISGVSFLGAGIIFRNGTSIRGLTTAAGIWATAGIGLAIGAGMYVIGIFATAVVALLQVFMHKYALSADSMIVGQIHCHVQRSDAFRAALNQYISAHKMQIVASKIAFDEDGSATYDLTLRMSQDMTLSDLSGFLESNEGIREIRCELGK
ncbi:MAG: MgtC/SapB family protein [Clostridia bacterium]|nr:MgtC/SapB family protein [Clostridia bacterium]